MDIPNIRDAVNEARRFIDKAEDLLKTVERRKFENSSGFYEVYEPGKTSAALKRASLDLTRALAEMRRP